MDPCDRAVISVRKPSRQSDEAFSLSSACWRSGEGILPMKPAQHKIFFEDGSFVDICGDFIFYRPGDGTGEGVVDWLVGCFGFNGPLRRLVGCFGFNGPLRQYFSLYRAISQGEGEGEENG